MKLSTLLLRILGRDAHVELDSAEREARRLAERQADAARRLEVVEATTRAVTRRRR